MKYTITEGFYPNNEDNDMHFKGNGWGVEKLDDVYLLEYISGEHRGRLKKVKITEEDFELLKAEKININDICIKYNVT